MMRAKQIGAERTAPTEAMMMKNWLEEARTQGYLVVRRNHRHAVRASAWLTDCERTGRAYVLVESRRKYATVDMDLFLQNFQVPESAVELLKKLILEYNDGFPVTIPGAGSTVVRAARVPIERAEELAGKLAKMAVQWKAAAKKEKER